MEQTRRYQEQGPRAPFCSSHAGSLVGSALRSQVVTACSCPAARDAAGYLGGWYKDVSLELGGMMPSRRKYSSTTSTCSTPTLSRPA